MDPTEGDTIGQDPVAELTANFSEIARLLFSAGSVNKTLEQIVAISVETVEGCDFAGLFLVQGDIVVTPLSTDPIVEAIDLLQHQAREGPCLDALAQGAMVYGDDLSTDPRWPNFGPKAGENGIRSALALPLTANGAVGAVNLYAVYSSAFGVVDRAKGVILSSLASAALAAAHLYEDEERRIENLHSALSSREIIGQAQGILMERERIPADQAFDVLRRASQYLNIKLREVAQTLVDTGERPDTGPRDRRKGDKPGARD
jgi:GAF domain-containing protein